LPFSGKYQPDPINRNADFLPATFLAQPIFKTPNM